MEDNNIENQKKETFIKATKLYFGSLMPFNNNIFQRIYKQDLDKLDISKNQVYVSKEDIHRELFVNLLTLMAKAYGRKLSYSKITLNQLVDYNFSPERKPVPRFLTSEVLLIIHATPTKDNKIYGPILDQVVEERRTYGKKTYLFYKGVAPQYRALKSNSLVDIVDFNPASNSNNKAEDIF